MISPYACDSIPSLKTDGYVLVSIGFCMIGGNPQFSMDASGGCMVDGSVTGYPDVFRQTDLVLHSVVKSVAEVSRASFECLP